MIESWLRQRATTETCIFHLKFQKLKFYSIFDQNFNSKQIQKFKNLKKIQFNSILINWFKKKVDRWHCHWERLAIDETRNRCCCCHCWCLIVGIRQWTTAHVFLAVWCYATPGSSLRVSSQRSPGGNGVSPGPPLPARHSRPFRLREILQHFRVFFKVGSIFHFSKFWVDWHPFLKKWFFENFLWSLSNS